MTGRGRKRSIRLGIPAQIPGMTVNGHNPSFEIKGDKPKSEPDLIEKAVFRGRWLSL